LNRDQLEHVIFAVAELTGDSERSRPQDAEKASIIGELTSFHDLNG
jgi:hypothetical protein